ncbi:MBL fold metallo-hydrolase [Halostagnicola bangensis]
MSSAETDAGVHALALTLEFHGRELTITPTVVETDRGLVLIDVGPEGAVGPLETALSDLGFSLSDLWMVVVTHHDGDHAGGLAELRSRVDVPVAAHPEEAPYITGAKTPIKGDGDRYPPESVDIELVGGSRLSTAVGPIELLETPGHSPGHLSLYVPDERLLIAGDALVSDGTEVLSGPKPEFTPEMDRALESVETLAALEIDHVLCFHGGYSRAGSGRIAEIARVNSS